jgi:exonuclease SbcD
LEEVEAAIIAFDNQAFELVAWADVLVKSDEAPAEVQRRVQAALKERRAAVLAPRGVRHQRLTDTPDMVADASLPIEHLHELTVEEVFRRRVAGLPPERADTLTATFQELRQLLAEADPQAWGGEAL